MKNDKRDILLHLYGELAQSTDLRSLLKDEELRDEHAALSEAKFRLDHRAKERPSQDVLDHIIAAAAAGTDENLTLKRRDRKPIARTHSLKKILIPALSLAAAILFGVGMGWIGGSSNQVPASAPSALADDSVVPPESLYRYVPPRQNALRQASERQSRLAWDDDSSLPNLHRRIITLNPSNGTDWGSGALPLEVLPTSQNRGFQTAGSNN